MEGRKKFEVTERLSCQDENVLVRPNMKERVKALREETILEAAKELIERKGYAAMTLDELTEMVGISKPTLYLHFRSKEDVTRGVACMCLQESLDFLAGLDPEKPAADRIREFVTWAMDRRFGANSVLMQDLMNHISPIKEPGSPHAIAENELIDAVFQLLVEAQREGGIRQDLPPAFLGAMLLAFVKYSRMEELMSTYSLGITDIMDGWKTLLAG